MSTLVVGVDIAQQTFVAASWQHGSGHLFGTFPNNDAGFAALAAARPSANSIHLVMEPTELVVNVFGVGPPRVQGHHEFTGNVRE